MTTTRAIFATVEENLGTLSRKASWTLGGWPAWIVSAWILAAAALCCALFWLSEGVELA